MNTAAWAWEVPAAALAVSVVVEAWLAARQGLAVPGTRSARAWAGLYVSLAVLFGAGLAAAGGRTAAGQFYVGYLTEYSLSLDNLFVFYVIMRWFAVPPARQRRVLLMGILLALVLRSALIVAGSAAVSHFGWLFYPLAGILVWTGVRLAKSRPGEQPAEPRGRLMSWLRRRARAAGDEDGGHVVTWQSGRPAAGPLLLLAVAIGSADLLFAFDSIPALLGITTNAWLIIACNAFALMGLRQVYVLLVQVLDRIAYLNQGLAVICAFIGTKLLLQALRSSGAAWAPLVPAWLSFAVVGAVLVITVTAGALGSRLTADGTALAGEEPSVLLRRFAVIDSDGNGVWQRADFERHARRLCDALGHGIDSAPAVAVASAQHALFNALLAHMDANGDQQITPAEFTGSVGHVKESQHGFHSAVRAAASALVQAADQDGNGVLDAAEYARLASVYGASSEQAANAFDRLDLDRNGFLDTSELTLALSQFFASPDADAPGNLAFGRL